MSSPRADDMAWGWLLEMPPMRYSHSNDKIAIFLSHSAARNGACDALHDREGRVRAWRSIALPSPAKPCELGPPSPAVRERVSSAARRVRVFPRPRTVSACFSLAVSGWWQAVEDPIRLTTRTDNGPMKRGGNDAVRTANRPVGSSRH